MEEKSWPRVLWRFFAVGMVIFASLAFLRTIFFAPRSTEVVPTSSESDLESETELSFGFGPKVRVYSQDIDHSKENTEKATTAVTTVDGITTIQNKPAAKPTQDESDRISELAEEAILNFDVQETGLRRHYKLGAGSMPFDNELNFAMPPNPETNQYAKPSTTKPSTKSK